MFKKTLVALCALTMAGAACAWTDGSYVGKGEGKGGPMKVKVVVEGGKIASVEVLRHGETEAIMAGALAQVPAAIVAKNSPDVDAVGGATLSSTGIRNAVADALKKAQ